MILTSIALLLATSTVTTSSIYVWLHWHKSRRPATSYTVLSLKSSSLPLPLPLPTTPLPYDPAIFLKYDRRLCTGIGDRMSVFLSVAAMARAVNASCYVYWWGRLILLALLPRKRWMILAAAAGPYLRRFCDGSLLALMNFKKGGHSAWGGGTGSTMTIRLTLTPIQVPGPKHLAA